MTPFKAIAAAVVVFAAAQAHAISFTVTDSAFSTVAGVATDTFDADATISLSPTGGAFFSTAVNQITAKPPGSTGQWWSLGTSGGQDGPGIVRLNFSTTYYGFLWGSPDTYNSVEFYSGNSLVKSFSGSDVFAQKADGFQGSVSAGQYVNFWADEGEHFDEVRFLSGGNAFETDNHAVFTPINVQVDVLTAPVPEPETYALMLAGLCAIGFMARNRRRD